jgi:hypothetical protein
MYSQRRTHTGEAAMDGDKRMRRRIRQVVFMITAAVILNSVLMLKVWQFLSAPSVEMLIECLETTLLLLAFTLLGKLS